MRLIRKLGTGIGTYAEAGFTLVFGMAIWELLKTSTR
jgi:hypothetical protein